MLRLLTLACLAWLASLASGFMNLPGIRRVQSDAEFHRLGSDTNKVIVLITHYGKCDRKGCKDFEDMLTNFYEVPCSYIRNQNTWPSSM